MIELNEISYSDDSGDVTGLQPLQPPKIEIKKKLQA
jgi:hypothetical protein